MCCACDGGSGSASPTTAPTRSSAPTGSHAPTEMRTQVGGFMPLDQACDALEEGEHLNVEVVNDITFGEQIVLEEYRSLRLFADATASRKALTGGGTTRLFKVSYGPTLELQHLELRDGSSPQAESMGGGLFWILDGALLLIDCLVRDGYTLDHVRGARGVWEG